jgi:type II secretory pathway pseudopilin PulG
LQNPAKNSAFNHRFYNLFSDIFSGAVLKQAYRLGQRVTSHVVGWFTQNSANNNSIQGTLNVRSVGQMRRKFLTTCTIKGTRGGNLQADVPQYGRFLPICAKDTPHFWSDVYKVGTRARKAQVDLVQGGRSMIEMLGVLAIIGVLSVGGIAGYSKAMTKFKINKSIDLVSQVAANVRTLYSSQGSYTDLVCIDDRISLCQKAKIVPDDAIQNGYIKNPFGGDVRIVNDAYWDFTVELFGLPEDACMELATLDWSAATSSGLNAIGVNTGVTGQVKNCGGDADEGIACVGGETVSVPMPVSLAAQHCSGNGNYITLSFY